ncbi:EscU/YscU/HrcU family type III secretion system export apparatus switch protein [Gephyromycinifex aptenodytis]|uniref:EscU/YscU/HrcU family type III secretion system export apparatus switch protein n=1 Tax=Gephyromycinifex aptenodytis TaxID=2716227 RepID=UPI001446DF12|nr:EscU/YscU/HrcU family type III secretion system export apparatus switch protein [Gephyromycinifex aptenodytis]
MADDKSSKTEKATPQKAKEAKQEGNVAKTQDLSMWLTVLAFVAFGPMTVRNLSKLVDRTLHTVLGIIHEPVLSSATALFKQTMLSLLWTIGPLVLACMFLGTLGQLIQGGNKPHPKRFKPKWKKLNPVTGLKNMFGMQGAWNLVKTLIKFVVFGFVAYGIVSGTITEIAGSGTWSLTSVIQVTQKSAMQIITRIALVGLVIAAADYGMERHRVGKSMRMSKDEIKKESKQQEGDPMVKGMRRQKQREMGRRRMMAAVGDSTVVLTNPARIAVALKYEKGSGAPQVVAKGTGFLAKRIREEAEAQGIPLVEDVIVARMLYKMCDIDDFIPFELYDTIAQVLAFVMRMGGLGRSAGTHRSPLRHPGFDGRNLPEDLTDEALGIHVDPVHDDVEPGSPASPTAGRAA